MILFTLVRGNMQETVTLMPLSRDTIKLLRIPFSLFLMPVFLLALSQVSAINLYSALISFILIHFLVYPASNGYNSYIDRDKGSIGGLEKPPVPTRQLFYTTLVMDLISITAGLFLVGTLFSFCILIYIAASRAYSAPRPRLKKYPLAGFLVVVIFQGAFTYLFSYIGVSGFLPPPGKSTFFILLAASFQIAGAYPLTQIYQHAEDKAAGVTTLSSLLGYKGTFIFTAVMFGLCNLFYLLYFLEMKKAYEFYLLQLFFLPVVIYFIMWFYKTLKDPSRANFRNTMRMNLIACVCMSSCFILFLLLKNSN